MIGCLPTLVSPEGEGALFGIYCQNQDLRDGGMYRMCRPGPDDCCRREDVRDADAGGADIEVKLGGFLGRVFHY